MKVALDASAVPAQLTGAGRYVSELASRLPGAGCDLTLVTRRDDVTRWRDVAGAHVAGVVPSGRVGRLAYEALILGRSAVARACDVWHAPHYTMPRTGSASCAVTIHDLTFFSHPEFHEASKVAFFRRAIRHSARHARVLIAVSEMTARLLDEYVGVHAPVVVAPHGVDLEHFALEGDDAALTTAGLTSTAPYVLFVGTLEPRKGLDVLLTAFGDVAARHPDLELWIAGRAGWGDVALPGPEHARVRRLGYVDASVLPGLMRRAVAVAYPSRAEGFGLPVLEALACGAPTITTRATVMEEVAGEAALLCDIGDATSLAAAINVAAGLSASERRARALAGRSRAEQYSWAASVERHLEAYRIAAG